MQDRSPPARRNHLQRTAGPYIWVKRRNTHCEQTSSAVAPNADMQRLLQCVRFVPMRIGPSPRSLQPRVLGKSRCRKCSGFGGWILVIRQSWKGVIPPDPPAEWQDRDCQPIVYRADGTGFERLILTGQCFNLAGEAIDALIQPAPVACQLLDDTQHAGRQGKEHGRTIPLADFGRLSWRHVKITPEPRRFGLTAFLAAGACMPRQQAKLARGAKDKEHAMSQIPNSAIAVIGIDIGKNSFHVVGHDARGAIVLRQKWSRGQVEARLANVPPCLIGMEACVGAHHLSRNLASLGHLRG
jgi:hypothetical protein